MNIEQKRAYAVMLRAQHRGAALRMGEWRPIARASLSRDGIPHTEDDLDFISRQAWYWHMAPDRIQLKRTKGWRMPPNTVKVDRSTPWGNPHPVGYCALCDKVHTAAEAVAIFRRRMTDEYALQVKENLAGKNLACWCKPGQPCHANTLIEVANEGGG